jgi:mediator of RNA polymerase II transcription subunit 5
LYRLLYSKQRLLDIVALHVRLADLVGHGIVVLEEFDPETVGESLLVFGWCTENVDIGLLDATGTLGDPQTAVNQLGDVVIFLQVAIIQYQVSPGSLQVSRVYA